MIKGTRLTLQSRLEKKWLLSISLLALFSGGMGCHTAEEYEPSPKVHVPSEPKSADTDVLARDESGITAAMIDVHASVVDEVLPTVVLPAVAVPIEIIPEPKFIFFGPPRISGGGGPPRRCGNGRVESLEQCDDGNSKDFDGCSSTCISEVCGDGIIQGSLGEQCDDGNTVDDGNGCSATCLANNVCGNSIVESAVEGCDDGGMGACTPDCCFPLFETNMGAPLSLSDDSFVEVAFPNFVFPLQGNGMHQSTFINSNGNVTFTEGDNDFTESVTEFLQGPPRLGTLWDDLDPEGGGTIHFEDLGNRVVVTWLNITEFGDIGSNTFQLQFNHEGKVLFTYGALSLLDGLVGVTPGNGTADPGPLNFDPALPLSPATFSLGATPTVYQRYLASGPINNLDNQSIYFIPHANDEGWDLSRFP